MLVGDGWYDSANFKPRSRKFKAEHSVLFQIKIDYEDGTSEMVVSDDAVKVSESPVRSSDCLQVNSMTHGWNRKTGTVADSMTAAGKQVSHAKNLTPTW